MYRYEETIHGGSPEGRLLYYGWRGGLREPSETVIVILAFGLTSRTLPQQMFRYAKILTFLRIVSQTRGGR